MACEMDTSSKQTTMAPWLDFIRCCACRLMGSFAGCCCLVEYLTNGRSSVLVNSRFLCNLFHPILNQSLNVQRPHSFRSGDEGYINSEVENLNIPQFKFGVEKNGKRRFTLRTTAGRVTHRGPNEWRRLWFLRFWKHQFDFERRILAKETKNEAGENRVYPVWRAFHDSNITPDSSTHGILFCAMATMQEHQNK